MQEGEEGGWGRGMMTGQTNNRDGKAIKENRGKEFKTQKGKGTKINILPRSSPMGHVLVET